ncbi:MAG: hypothetical protein Unbinned8472contig1000_69 [Prokaryotic dsDNA virus sp.]|nr:MAG: hypothetical protein Unbinned8472contig1000_69 [Prokaryotic dsDNA virus sp.]|tara:strand:+ start:44320 stop:44481 length:162 start_codon:yes stop_codon:yes gene_type:complete
MYNILSSLFFVTYLLAIVTEMVTGKPPFLVNEVYLILGMVCSIKSDVEDLKRY